MFHKLKMYYMFLAFSSCLHIATCDMRDGVYRIENLSDKLHITTEGANTAFAKVVGENWQNFGEQRWNVLKAGPGSDAFHLTAEKHTTNNALSFFRDPAKKYALPEKWTLISVANDGYQIQNQRTGFCLISGGRRKEIVEGKCDKYLPDRHWRFLPLRG